MKNVLLLLLCLPLCAGAQTDAAAGWQPGLRFGLSAGPSLSQFPEPQAGLLSGQSDAKAKSGRHVGFQAYGIAGYAFTPHFELEGRAGVGHSRLYGVRSSTGNAPNFLNGGSTSYTKRDTLDQQSTWLEVPLFARFRLFRERELFLEGGAIAALPMKVAGSFASYRSNSAAGPLYEAGEAESRFQAGFHFGMGFFFRERYQISMSWARRAFTGGSREGDGLPVRLWRLTAERYF